MTVFYVDVSHHDVDRRGSAINWAQVAAAGIVASCAKASEGDPSGYWYTDPAFAANTSGALSAGLLAGGYHVLSAGDQSSINRQVDAFRTRLSSNHAQWAMVDVEPFDELTSRGIAPRIDDVKQFIDRWHALDSRPLLVYLPKWYWSNLGSPAIPNGGLLVSSNYDSSTDGQGHIAMYGHRGGDSGVGWAGYGGQSVIAWQFTSQSPVPGCSSATDVNAFRGTKTQLVATFTGQEDDMTLDEHNWLMQVYNATFFGGSSMGPATTKINATSAGNALIDLIQNLRVDMATVKSQLTALSTKDFVDEGAIATAVATSVQAAVLAGLSAQQIAEQVVAVLPPELAADVVSELGRRIGTS